MSIIDCSLLDLPNLRSVRSQTERCDTRTNGSWRGNSFAPSGNDPWQQKLFSGNDLVEILILFRSPIIIMTMTTCRCWWSSSWRWSPSRARAGWFGAPSAAAQTPRAEIIHQRLYQKHQGQHQQHLYTILITVYRVRSNGVKKRSLLVLYIRKLDNYTLA